MYGKEGSYKPNKTCLELDFAKKILSVDCGLAFVIANRNECAGLGKFGTFCTQTMRGYPAPFCSWNDVELEKLCRDF